MIRAATYPLERVLPFIGVQKELDLDGDIVSLTSLRMQCFKKYGIVCVGCGVVGSYFATEKCLEKDHKYHLNLYALSANGKEILMTRDHKISKALGGADVLDNLQPMCTICNAMKGNGLQGAGKTKKKGSSIELRTSYIIERVTVMEEMLKLLLEHAGIQYPK
jgi:hypothetical protein